MSIYGAMKKKLKLKDVVILNQRLIVYGNWLETNTYNVFSRFSLALRNIEMSGWR